MKQKISMADQFYDSCCAEYTLKYREPGEFRVIRTGKGTAKVSSYGMENIGTVALVRASNGLFKKAEAAIFTPTMKDAPILMMDYVRTLGGENLSINIFKTQIAPLSYRQFSSLEESYSKLPDADVPGEWYNSMLIPGSVAKKGSNVDLSAMLEEYLTAYLKIVHYAEACKEIDKASKTRELSQGFLDNGGTTADQLIKNMGKESLKKFFDEIIFPLKIK